MKQVFTCICGISNRTLKLMHQISELVAKRTLQ